MNIQILDCLLNMSRINVLNDKETSCLDGWVMKRDECGRSGGEEEAGRGVKRKRKESFGWCEWVGPDCDWWRSAGWWAKQGRGTFGGQQGGMNV